jgi:glycogen(starch) synthase
MEILIYSHSFAPNIGGVETYVMLLARGLARVSTSAPGDTVHVTVVTLTPADGMDDSALPFRVVRQPGFLAFLKLLRDGDVIHIAGPCFLPMLLGLVLRKPVVVEQHGYQAVCPNGLLLYEPTKSICPGHFMARRYHKCVGCNAKNIGWARSLVKLFLTIPRRWACQLVTANIGISNHLKDRINLARTKVIYYGIPDPVYGKEQRRDDCTADPSRPPSFAYVGRLVSEKGLDLLVDAAQTLSTDHDAFSVKFIGDGPERMRLQSNVSDFGLCNSVVFTGYLDGADLDSALEDVDAVVMPSIWEETAGLSAIEHMMRGRLVIAADVGGLGEMVGEAGLKFRVGDVAGLSSCMKRVLSQPDLRKELGGKARERALQLFRQGRMVKEHVEVYSEVFPEPCATPRCVGERR